MERGKHGRKGIYEDWEQQGGEQCEGEGKYAKITLSQNITIYNFQMLNKIF